MARKRKIRPVEDPDEALTRIHGRIHCGATPDTTEGMNELDALEVETFLEMLAEVAMTVARRRDPGEAEEGGVGQ